MNHLRGIAQQRLRHLPAEPALQASAQAGFEHQPEPADQHDQRDHLGQPGVAFHQHETGDAGDESEQRNGAGIASDQIAAQLEQARQQWLELHVEAVRLRAVVRPTSIEQ